MDKDIDDLHELHELPIVLNLDKHLISVIKVVKNGMKWLLILHTMGLTD